MIKEIEININKNNELKGTTSWLAKNADHVDIGETKDGMLGAWLRDKNNKTLSVLAIKNWCNDGKIKTVEAYTYEKATLCPDFEITEACLGKLQEIAKETAKIMEEIWEEDSANYDFKISVYHASRKGNL